MNNNDNSKNKKIFIFIILDLIILVVLVILLFITINNEKISNSGTPNTDEAAEIGIPNVKNIITYKAVPFLNYINSFSIVFDNNYYWIQNRLYDENGKILVDGYDDIKSTIIEDKYIYANNKLYSTDGKLLLDNLDTRDIKINKDYLVVGSNKYYDSNMKLVFDGSKYEEIKDFNGKYAIAYENGLYSLIDNNNKILVSGDYDNIKKINSENFLLQNTLDSYVTDYYIYNTKNNNKYGPYAYCKIINDNKAIVDIYSGNSEDRTLEAENDKLKTFILNLNDFSTKSVNNIYTHDIDSILFNGKYFSILDYISGKGFKYKLLDKDFKQINELLYDEITVVKDDYLLLTDGSKHSLVNKELKELFNFNYDSTNFLEDIIDYDNNMFIVSTDDNSYLFDLSGKSIYNSNGVLYFKYSYNNYYFFDEMREDGESCIYINTKSKKDLVKKIDNTFCENLYLSKNQFITKNQNEKYYLYNVSLKQVFENYYDYIEIFDTFCLTKVDGFYYVISYDEKKILEDKFSDYHVTKNNKLFLEKEDGSLYYFNYE